MVHRRQRLALRGRLRFESLEEDISNGGLVFGLFNTHTLGLWLFMRAGKENPAKNFKLRKAVEPRKNAQNTKKAEHGEPNALIRWVNRKFIFVVSLCALCVLLRPSNCRFQ